MKRYERMTKEEIVEFAGNCHTRGCEGCPALDVDGLFGTCMKKYLEQEIQMVPRYSTIKSDEDMEKVVEGYKSFCDSRNECGNCKIYAKRNDAMTYMCFVEYLKEQIETEEEEK